jgi:hypothetical protein
MSATNSAQNDEPFHLGTWDMVKVVGKGGCAFSEAGNTPTEPSLQGED